jgi:hypothetical protein
MVVARSDSFQMHGLLVGNNQPAGVIGLASTNISTGTTTLVKGLIEYVMTGNGDKSDTVLSRAEFYRGEDGQPTNSIVFSWHPSS